MDLDTLARRQHGIVTTAQALACGMTTEEVRWRLVSGRWRSVARGIHATHSGPLDWWARAQAAVLRGGAGSALTLRSAAYVHGVEARAPAVITVGIPASRKVVRLPGTRVTRRRQLSVVLRRGLPVTPAAATVLDLADVPGCHWQEAVGLAATWVQQRRVTVDELVDAIDARSRLHHRGVLLTALGVVARGAESLLEVGYVRRVERPHGLPHATLQVPVAAAGGTLRRDAEYEEWRVVVELDGRLGHEGAGLARDRRRDRGAAAEGRVTLRAGWVDVEADPCALALDVHQTLRARGWRGSGRGCGPHCVLGRVINGAA